MGNPYSVGLEVGDQIIGVDGKKVSIMKSFDDLLPSSKKEGDKFDLLILRDGEEMTVTVTMKKIVNEEEKIDYIGFGFVQQSSTIKANFGYALKYCVPYAIKLAFMVLSSFGALITGSLPLTSMTGPVGTVGFMAEIGMADARNFLVLLPLLSANLAIFNILPIPALDGSKVIFTAIEWIRKKPLNRKIENIIHTVGILFLFAFVIVIDLLGIFT
jgi:regulator of sigma E protease